jgi:hypothetical protein
MDSTAATAQRGPATRHAPLTLHPDGLLLVDAVTDHARSLGTR